MDAITRLEERLASGEISPARFADELDELTERQERVGFALAVLTQERKGRDR